MVRLFLSLFVLLSFPTFALAQSAEQQTYAPFSSFEKELRNPSAGQGQAPNKQTHAPFSSFKNNSEAIANTVARANRSQSGFIKPKQIYLSLVHYDYMDNDQFGVLMKAKDNITGCYDITPLHYEAKFIEPYYMDVEVNDYRRTPKATNEPCDLRTQNISSLMVLNKKDLQRRQIRQIRFSNGAANDFYDVRISRDSVALHPRSQIVFKATDSKGVQRSRLALNSMDDNIIALQVPMAQKGDNIELQLRNLAYQSDMQPIFEKAGLDTTGTDNIFYFTDQTGKSLSMLGDTPYMELGEIEVKRPYQSSRGLTVTPVALKVFAMLPKQ